MLTLSLAEDITLQLPDIDGKITKYILDNVSLLSKVHPNVITMSGVIANLLIVFLLTVNLFWAFLIVLFYRYLADCVDGGVARKYNKKSKLGGILDTLSDNMLIYIICWAILYKLDFDSALFISFVPMMLNLIIMFKLNSIVEHDAMKVGNSLPMMLYSMAVNNSLFSFIAFAIVIRSVS